MALALCVWLAWTVAFCVGLVRYLKLGCASSALSARPSLRVVANSPAAAHAADGTPSWALVAGGAPAKRAFVFVGGLQRSGTTLVEAWLAYAPGAKVSFLSEKHVSPAQYELLAPWQMHNHTRAYFEIVIKSGGLEGKFVQDVYAYRNLFYELGLRGESAVRALALGASDVPQDEAARAAARSRLLGQWRRYTAQAQLEAGEDWGDGGGGLQPAPRAAAAAAAIAGPHYHLEKTPENLLIAPFLRALLRPLPCRFVLTARHPLAWALATEKWVRDEFVHMRRVAERVRGWLAVMELAQELTIAPGRLPSAVTLSVESFAAHPAMQHQLLSDTFGLAAARACLLGGGDSDAAQAELGGRGGAGWSAANASSREVAVPSSLGLSARAPSACAPLPGFISHSYGYAACWLHGGSLETATGKKHLLQCAQGLDGVVLAGRAQRRQAELIALAAELEPRLRPFGYSFAPFLQLRAGAYWRPLERLEARGPWADMLVGVRADAPRAMAAGWLRPPERPAMPTGAMLKAAMLMGSAGTAARGGDSAGPHVLVAYELSLGNFSAARAHSGMNQRMLQVVGSLRRLGCAIHLVSFHSSAPPVSGPAAVASLPAELRPPAVAAYAGTFEEQVSTVLLLAGERLRHALIFGTHLTQNLHQQAERDDARAQAFAAFNAGEIYPRAHLTTKRADEEPPPLSLPPERALLWVRSALPRCAIALVTDDLHHKRVSSALAEHASSVDLPKLTRWLRARELELYASADVAFAVSPEDAAEIGAGFSSGAGSEEEGEDSPGSAAAVLRPGEPLGALAVAAPDQHQAALRVGGRGAQAAMASLAAECARDPLCLGVRLRGECVRLRQRLVAGGALALMPALDAGSRRDSRLVFSRLAPQEPLAAAEAARRPPSPSIPKETGTGWGASFAIARGVRARGAASADLASEAEGRECSGAAIASSDEPAGVGVRALLASVEEGVRACEADSGCAGVEVEAGQLGVSAGLGLARGVTGSCDAVLLRVPQSLPPSGRLRWSQDARTVTLAKAGTVHARWLPFVLDPSAARAAQRVLAAGAAWTVGDRRGLFYVGQPHPLSIVAVGWLCAHVLPLLAASGLDTQPGGLSHLRIAGPHWESKASAQSTALSLALAAGHVSLLGELSDAQLEAEFSRARVFAAPLVNATGIATKNVHALARGLPTVSGADGARGLGFGGRRHAARVMKLSDDPAQFAADCRQLLTDDGEWAEYARASAAHVLATLSATRLDALLGEFLRGEAGADEVLELHARAS